MLFHMRQKERSPTWSLAYALSWGGSGSGNGWKDQRWRDSVDKVGISSFQPAKPFNQIVNQVKGEINYEPREILSNQVSKTEQGTFQNTARFATCMVGSATYALSSENSSLFGLAQGS